MTPSCNGDGVRLSEAVRTPEQQDSVKEEGGTQSVCHSYVMNVLRPRNR